MSIFFMDESGYTGFDLLNDDQRFQGASAIKITEMEARRLIEAHFPRTQCAELKHRRLSRRQTNWSPLLDLQRTALSEYLTFTYVCDKRFLLTLMFLDSCIEPFYYEQGIDFYQDGYNYGLASLIYCTAPTFWGTKNFEDLLFLFQRAQRTKTEVAIQALVEKAKSLRGMELSENLLPLTYEAPACLDEMRNPVSNTDAVLVVMISLISHIEKHVGREYQIVHDRSNNLRRYNEILSALATSAVEKEFKATQITSLKFPLRFTGVSQEDSNNSYGIQLADILIGGMIECSMALAGKVRETAYNQAVAELYRDNQLIHLLPNLDFEEQREFRKGSQAGEMINFIAEHFS